MFTVKNTIISGSDLPEKGRILLTNSPSFILHEYSQPAHLFKNPNTTASSSQGFMRNDILYKSLEILIRDHYAPLTGWVEMSDTDIYLAWNNYKNGVYSPTFPIHFETASIDTDYDTFNKMVQRYDPSLNHSDSIYCHTVQKETHPLFFDKEPLFFVKVTRLEPDNQAVVVSFVCSHMVMDGCSVMNFYFNWAALYKHIESGLGVSSCLDCKLFNAPLFGAPDFGKSGDLKNEACNREESEEEEFEDYINNYLTLSLSPNEISEYCLEIPKPRQEKVREKAHSLGVSFNTYLSAILWKESILVWVEHDPSIINKVSSFKFYINIRPILNAPDSLCSSAVITCSVRIAVKDILEMNTAGIAQTIKSRLKLATTPENVCKKVNRYIAVWKEACRYSDDVFAEFTKLSVSKEMGIPMFEATSLLNFKFSDVDFGAGGPVSVRMPKYPISGLICITSPNQNVLDNDIQVYISYPKGCDISHSAVLSELSVSKQ